MFEQYYIHIESGRSVLPIFHGEMRMPDKSWVASTTYKVEDNQKIYTRPTTEFNELFRPEGH